VLITSRTIFLKFTNQSFFVIQCSSYVHEF